MSKVAELGCIACLRNGYETPDVELHHIRSGQGMGQKASNYDVIGLCPPHHRTGGYGIAFHAGKKAFESQFGTEQELLAQVKSMV